MEVIGKIACLVLLSMVVLAPQAEAAISCGQVTGALAPCFSYLTTGSPITYDCCNGVRGLNSAAATSADRQAACNCIMSLQSSVSPVNPANAASLPGKCGVTLPFKISLSMDCTKIR